MKNSLRSRDAASKAAALIIVLAFVVLLTGLALAYFTGTTTDRQLAQSSYNDTSADLLARSALDIVVGDFKQEIVNGSISPIPAVSPAQTSGPFIPTVAANVVPQRNVTPIPNLIRISLRGDPIIAPAVGSRASDVSSTDPSANGRFISTTRWNKHCLIPTGSGATISNPVPTPPSPNPTPVHGQTPTTWDPPDWVIVTRAGPTPCATLPPDGRLGDPTNDNYAIGRYAYAVYDEGGLLDINVAGYPSPAPGFVTEYTTDVGRKGVLAWADLSAIVPTPSPVPANIGIFINRIVGTRNYATTGQSNVSNWNYSFSNTPPPVNISKFIEYYLGGGIGTPKPGTSRDFGAVNPVSAPDGRTDQSFVTRAELIQFVNNAATAPPAPLLPFHSLGVLQCLGTFSREQNKPTLPLTPAWPSTWPKVVLPQRFYLGNLNLVQYPTPTPPPTDPIRTYFGLELVASPAPTVSPNPSPCDNQIRWKYVGTNPSNHTPLLAIPAFPSDLTTTTPDFFQYINYALFGVTTADSDPTRFPFTLGIGAALIDLYDADTLVTGIYYGLSAATCDPTIAACLVYGAENGTTVSPTVGAGCMSSVPQVPQVWPAPSPSINTPTRNVGEFGWAYSILNAASTPLRNTNPPPNYVIDFKDAYNSATNPDPALLDFFTFNKADSSAYQGAPVRSGIVSLNTRQVPVLTAILKLALYQGGANLLNQTQATSAANSIVTDATTGTIANPAMSRADIARFVAPLVAGTSPFSGVTGNSQDVRDVIARALSETTQTRTWGLLIDVVAQTGHYKPNATGLADFVVEGEKRYWLHIAIDRFDGTIVGQQLEEVTE